MILAFSVFLRIIPPTPSYTSIPTRDGSEPRGGSQQHEEAGRQTTDITSPSLPQPQSASFRTGNHLDPIDADENSSLVSKNTIPSRVSEDGDNRQEDQSYHQDDVEVEENGSHYPDIRGMALLSKPEFWQLFLMMALLSGIGLMTIK
jgi:hypothetical protein